MKTCMEYIDKDMHRIVVDRDDIRNNSYVSTLNDTYKSVGTVNVLKWVYIEDYEIFLIVTQNTDNRVVAIVCYKNDLQPITSFISCKNITPDVCDVSVLDDNKLIINIYGRNKRNKAMYASIVCDIKDDSIMISQADGEFHRYTMIQSLMQQLIRVCSIGYY